MKKIYLIKQTILLITSISAIIFIVSCNNNPKTEDTKNVAEEHNDAKFDNNKQEKDAQFLVNAAEINLEEISLGQLAQQNGKTTHVKELGKMMEAAHRKSYDELLILAQTKMISIPDSQTDNAKDAYKKLNDKSGKDFDKAYADMMVSGHKDAIATFEKASNDCNDADIRNWATTMLPVLRLHLDESINCQKMCDKDINPSTNN